MNPKKQVDFTASSKQNLKMNFSDLQANAKKIAANSEKVDMAQLKKNDGRKVSKAEL